VNFASSGSLMRLSFLMIASVGCQADSGATLVGHALVSGESDSSGIEVTLAGPTSAVTRTAGDGSYRFAGLVAGSYLVSAHADATREGTLLADAVASQRAVPDFVFHPVGTLVGRVTRAASPAGNRGIVVLAPGSSGVATSDDSGAFRLAELAPGSYDLYAVTSGFLPGSARGVEVRRGETTNAPEIDLTAAPTGGPDPGRLHGIARPLGESDASNVTVTIAGGSDSAVTAADGSFTLPNPPDGIYSLSFARDLYSEVVPSVLALPDASGFYVDGSLYPLDGSTLLLSRGTRQIGGDLYNARLSPNGDFVLFTRYDDTPSPLLSLYTVPSSGGTPVLIADRASQVFSFSPDGTRVLYETGGSNNWDLWTAPVGGGTPASIATAATYAFGYSPDGAHVLYAMNGSDLWAAPALGGSGQLLAHQPTGPYRVSPAGDSVITLANCQYPYYQPTACDLLRVSFSGAAELLATTKGWFLGSPSLDRLLYSDGTNLISHELASGNKVTLSTALYGDSPLFLPDGQKVVFEETTPNGVNLDVVAAGGGTPQIILATKPQRMFLLSPGGKVVYLENPPSAVSVDGGPEKPIAQGKMLFSPKGQWTYVQSDYDLAQKTVTLSVAPAETGEMRVVAMNVLADAIAFSADDAQLAYLVDDGHLGASGWLEVAPAGGGSPNRILGGARAPLQFSQGGTRLLYGVGAAGTWPQIWSVAAAGGTPHGLAENSQAAFFAGDSVVFSISAMAAAPFSFQRGLYRLRAD
jgi:hypothetical protein